MCSQHLLYPNQTQLLVLHPLLDGHMLNISIVWSEELYPRLDLVPHQGGELSKIINVAPGQYFPH